MRWRAELFEVRTASPKSWPATALTNYALSLEEHSAAAPYREEQSPPLNKLFRQRHLVDDQVAALFNVMDFNPQILA